jgi:hypothetical protein
MNDFLKGWVIHYNFFRPHLSLHDKTPAQVAGIKFPYANWKELIEKQPYQTTSRINIVEHEPINVKHKPGRRVAKLRSPRKPKSKEIDLGAGVVQSHGMRHIKL